MKTETEAFLRDSLRGVAEIWQTDRGLGFDRLPAWTAPHHKHDPLTNQVSRQGSGVRLDFSTSATTITLTYRSLRDNPSRPSAVTIATDAFENTIEHSNGDLRLWNDSATFEFVPGEDSVATFDLPSFRDERSVSIWLPHNCEVELIDLAADAPLAPAPKRERTWVHYGSSISHCVEAENPLGVWSSRIAQDLGLNLANLGLAGSANVEYFAAKTIAATPADLISLKLGINVVAGATMTKRTFVAAVQAMLDIIRDSQPNTQIVLVSPIYCPGLETQPGPVTTSAEGQVLGSEFSKVDWLGELTLVGVREILQGIVESRQDKHLRYLSGLELFGERDVNLMPDHLHPNAEGYLLMADRATRLLFS
jgi:lysophospholipase L1-like esterase